MVLAFLCKVTLKSEQGDLVALAYWYRIKFPFLISTIAEAFDEAICPRMVYGIGLVPAAGNDVCSGDEAGHAHLSRAQTVCAVCLFFPRTIRYCPGTQCWWAPNRQRQAGPCRAGRHFRIC